jgi:biopolymer transport protein ExbB
MQGDYCMYQQSKYKKLIVSGIICLSFLGLFIMVPAVYAQEEAAAAEITAPTTFFDYWNQGGPTMWPLLALAVWSTALLIELLLKVRPAIFSPPDIIRQIKEALSVGDYQKAWRIAHDNPSPVSNVVAPAIAKLPQGREAVEDAAADASSSEMGIYTTKNSYISLVAAIAPMMGLFGTISGMIGAFNSMAYGGAVGDPTKLAGDIGEALITTYTGLLIAVPSMVIYYILGNRIKAVMGTVQKNFDDLIDQIDFEDLPDDLGIVTREMKSGTASGGEAAVAEEADEGSSEKTTCPNCGKEIEVGTKVCPHCNTEINWE